jgi:hypothetical protein
MGMFSFKIYYEFRRKEYNHKNFLIKLAVLDKIK